MTRFAVKGMTLAALALLAGCATPAPPPPTPPPPVIILPPPPAPVRPTPPNSAAPNLIIPISDLNGRRMTPNVDLTPEQALWQFRIGLNVAALNCRGDEGPALIANYSRFLTVHRTAIAASERRVIALMAAQTRTNGIAARDSLSTRMFNYFAQPPVLREFCRVSINLAPLAAQEPPANILPFASARLAEMDQPFVEFFNAYARYQADLNAWNLAHPEPGAPTGMMAPMATPLPPSSALPSATPMPGSTALPGATAPAAGPTLPASPPPR